MINEAVTMFSVSSTYQNLVAPETTSTEHTLQEMNWTFGTTEDSVVSSSAYNYSNATTQFLKTDDSSRRDSLYIVIPITVIYVAIFITGLVGNMSTCVVIARNKSMHTATNYYLFNLAISDLLLLISGLPPEMYYIWSQIPYIFGEVFCIIQGFAAETSSNATVLTITAFTVERYVAICHPFISHTMSKPSRAVKFVVAIWMLALGLAIPQAIQFGIVYNVDNGTVIEDTARCTVKSVLLEHAFEISTILFFVAPMTIITVLYILIGVNLRRSRLLPSVKRSSISSSINHGESARGKTAAQRNVIRMLVAVVMAFFICWAPFHTQRLLAVYSNGSNEEVLIIVYKILTYVSGVFYYLSTTINPLLYNIMSNKFREAFKSMLSQRYSKRNIQRKSSPRRPIYSALSRCTKQNYNHRPSASLSMSDETQKPVNQINLSRKSGSLRKNSTPKEEQFIQLRNNYAQLRANDTSREESNKRRSRGSSNSSQITVVTSISRGFSEGNNNLGFGLGVNQTDDCLVKKNQPHKNGTLGVLAEKLRLGTRGIFAPEPKTLNQKILPEVASAPCRLQSHPSIDSANTISNSSLQDLDETEFTGSELARYMGELNFNLIT